MEPQGTEEWSTASAFVTSTFRVLHRNGRPVGCETIGEKIYSSPCGLGWRFAMAFDTSEPEVDIFFDADQAREKLTGHSVNVSVELMSEDNVEIDRSGVEDISITSPVRIKSLSPADIAAHPHLSFKVTIPFVKRISMPSDAPEHVLHRTLLNSLDGSAFVDTKFVVFTRRLPDGRVVSPRALFAHSVLLKAKSKYFDTLLGDNGFLESEVADLGEEVREGMLLEAGEYDYESDSDIDEDNGTDDGDDAPDGVPRATGMSDNDKTPEASLVQPLQDSTHYQGQKGRVVVIKDVAFKTMRALLFYAYTGEIKFLPLGSVKPTSGLTSLNAVLAPQYVPSCSPKSMYRLADKLGMEDLEKLALHAIRSSLDEHNIVPEIFSGFTSRFKKVKDMEMGILCDHFNSSLVSSALTEMSKNLDHEGLQQFTQFLISLYARVSIRR
ncbi:hypothetical protein JAAARDRAFT_35387 [Jaapia argillacea MUCL 33604]|uniref:BTB domain-containing protein n=1 Tax=Jaapia argillacea MUCL 33604 TaxID=933084 RepID=A0A067PSB1_9AGAM|nr:hypothetical protein JAAARDRAFT_35387 [Jaapia argillacea MUCL 33604]